ncbi:Gp19/Gp15/Gp42 family protein [Tsukamurella paurometabola]|uniref:Phage protein Gp19/Gp15/Gp42 n=1 Tax=Tsukamurella paurometabola TaxID=2061 RepID=A0ABS5NI47_TSUPA|nr:Gp19/Gp15/Gp42 family protein [Tsukamurella paurometabola]MBS4103969.1 hypothetical protein [Tsukamurella paurometabola]
MTYATPADVSVLLARKLTTEEEGLAARRLGQVERMILAKIPDLADRVAADPAYAADVADVEADAVARVIRHGDGVMMETDGNYTYQKAYDQSSGKLELTSDEWETLGYRRSRMTALVPVTRRS